MRYRVPHTGRAGRRASDLFHLHGYNYIMTIVRIQRYQPVVTSESQADWRQESCGQVVKVDFINILKIIIDCFLLESKRRAIFTSSDCGRL